MSGKPRSRRKVVTALDYAATTLVAALDQAASKRFSKWRGLGFGFTMKVDSDITRVEGAESERVRVIIRPTGWSERACIISSFLRTTDLSGHSIWHANLNGSCFPPPEWNCSQFVSFEFELNGGYPGRFSATISEFYTE